MLWGFDRYTVINTIFSLLFILLDTEVDFAELHRSPICPNTFLYLAFSGESCTCLLGITNMFKLKFIVSLKQGCELELEL